MPLSDSMPFLADKFLKNLLRAEDHVVPFENFVGCVFDKLIDTLFLSFSRPQLFEKFLFRHRLGDENFDQNRLDPVDFGDVSVAVELD